jgi:hypothetical protein
MRFCLADHICRFLLSIQEMEMLDPDFIDQPRPQIFSEAGRVVRRQPNVFVEMEHLDLSQAMPGMPVRVSSSSNWDAPVGAMIRA